MVSVVTALAVALAGASAPASPARVADSTTAAPARTPSRVPAPAAAPARAPSTAAARATARHAARAMCPPADSAAVRAVRALLETHRSFLDAHGIPAIDADSARPLTGMENADACGQLESLVAADRRHVGYVTAGGYYFAFPERSPLSGRDGRAYAPEWRPVIVLDRAFAFVGTEGM